MGGAMGCDVVRDREHRRVQIEGGENSSHCWRPASAQQVRLYLSRSSPMVHNLFYANLNIPKPPA